MVDTLFVSIQMNNMENPRLLKHYCPRRDTDQKLVFHEFIVTKWENIPPEYQGGGETSNTRKTAMELTCSRCLFVKEL